MRDLFAPSLLIEPKVGARLSKTQQKFNALVQKVERLRAQAVEWGDTVPRQIERIQHEYAPLRNTYRALRIELVALLLGQELRRNLRYEMTQFCRSFLVMRCPDAARSRTNRPHTPR